MQIPLPPDLQPTNEMLGLIGSIEEFKGEWRDLGSLDPGTLRVLRRIATFEIAVFNIVFPAIHPFHDGRTGHHTSPYQAEPIKKAIPGERTHRGS